MNLSGELDADMVEAFRCSLAIVHSLLLSVHLCQYWVWNAGRFDETKCGMEKFKPYFQIFAFNATNKITQTLYLMKRIQSVRYRVRCS